MDPVGVVARVLSLIQAQQSQYRYGPYKVTCPAELLGQQYYKATMLLGGRDCKPITLRQRLLWIEGVEAVVPGPAVCLL